MPINLATLYNVLNPPMAIDMPDARATTNIEDGERDLGNIEATPRGIRAGADYYQARFINEPQARFTNEPTQPGFLDDEGINNWLPKELMGDGKKNKEIKIDKAILPVIEGIVNEIVEKAIEEIKSIYKIKLDNLENLEYTGFFDDAEHRENHLINTIHKAAETFKKLTTSQPIDDYSHQFLLHVEEIALKRYHIDYSKYKYYPRLKQKVKYGDTELLNKILSVTQVHRRKILWV